MARGRADNYDDKRRAILDRSAKLFAEHGYDRASINMIAKACGVSKGLLYHYYHDKDELLFDIIRAHLTELLETTERAAATASTPRDRLLALSASLLEAYSDADAEHQVQINHLRLLPPRRQEALREMERALVRRFSDAIAAAVPALGSDPELLKPVAMSLFGMLNWHYLWFRPKGPLSRDDYARLVTHLIVSGGDDLAAALRADTPARRFAAG